MVEIIYLESFNPVYLRVTNPMSLHFRLVLRQLCRHRRVPLVHHKRLRRHQDLPDPLPQWGGPARERGQLQGARRRRDRKGANEKTKHSMLYVKHGQVYHIHITLYFLYINNQAEIFKITCKCRGSLILSSCSLFLSRIAMNFYKFPMLCFCTFSQRN